MAQFTWSLGRLVARSHAMFALTLVLVLTIVMAGQVSRRHTFASTELYEDVMDRWGTPIVQAAPSVRYVAHGSVFHTLDPLPLTQQRVHIDAEMNYRKRGLVYFSGFDFQFRGQYAFINPRELPIDVAFVFPLSMARAQVLLSDLTFTVDGLSEQTALAPGDDKLLWTGKLEPGQRVEVEIGYRGRGLDSFLYALDPAMPVRGLDLTLAVTGGNNHDYPPGVVPATELQSGRDGATLRWRYDALEAGVPMGAILPSEKGFDTLVYTMIVRAWAPYLLFFVGLSVLGITRERPLKLYQMVLALSAYLFFYVLLAYFAAFTNFYVAYLLAMGIIGGLCASYLRSVLGREAMSASVMLLVTTLLTPTIAVMLQGYTGLIYTLELLALLAVLMVATTRPSFPHFLEALRLFAGPKETR